MTSCTRAFSGALGFGMTLVEGQSTFPVQLHPGSRLPLFLQSWPSSVGKEEGATWSLRIHSMSGCGRESDRPHFVQLFLRLEDPKGKEVHTACQAPTVCWDLMNSRLSQRSGRQLIPASSVYKTRRNGNALPRTHGPQVEQDSNQPIPVFSFYYPQWFGLI